jgi:hypothetical protein
MSLAACASTGQVERGQPASGDPVIGLLNKGIMQLNININTLSKRMNDAQQASAGTDPVLQELQALDLSGWQLHRQQWVLQRDHLVLARGVLERARQNQGANGPLLDEWRKHEQDYVRALEDLRQQRLQLETQHVEVENRLIERRLQ